jgi:hypothetical protein
MTLIMYERVGADGRRPSPFSWRIRYAMAHKGIEPEFRHVRFADVETIRALSGQHFVPIVTDGDRVIHDSWDIACYLEDRFPDRPSLFAGSGGRGLARLVNHWSDNTVVAAIRRLIAADFILASIPATAPITAAHAKRRSAARWRNIAPTGRAGSPSSPQRWHRWNARSPTSLISAARARAMPTTSSSRSSSTPGWAAPTSSSTRARRCGAGAPGSSRPLADWAIVIRGIRRKVRQSI